MTNQNPPPLPSPGEEDFSKPEARPLGIGFTVLVWALVLWAGIYVAANSGGFRADVYKATSLFPQSAPIDEASMSPQALGKLLFSQNCAICHLPDGMGVPNQFPPLVGSEWVTDRDWHGDNHLVKILLYGIQGPVHVRGAVYNNVMPSWPQFDDRQIAAILTYVRGSWGNDAPPVSPEFVGGVRKNTKIRQESWSESELRAIRPEIAPPPALKAVATPPPGGGNALKKQPD